MGEKEFRGNVMECDGIYKSTNAANTKKQSDLAHTETNTHISIDQSNPEKVQKVSVLRPEGHQKAVEIRCHWNPVACVRGSGGRDRCDIGPPTVFAGLRDEADPLGIG